MKNKRIEPQRFGWREASLLAIQPAGWLRDSLKRQRKGLTGHLAVAGYPFDTKGWLHEEIPLGPRGGVGWWPFEQYAYWIDGQIRCGLLLGDGSLKKRARRQLDHVLSHPDKDGYLGPQALKALQGGRPSERWPHAVLFRAIMADYDERPSKTTLNRLVKHYLSETAPHDQTRNVCNVEIMAWLYERTGDERLRDLALKSYRSYQRKAGRSNATITKMLSDERAGDHGPTYMELFKLGAVLYRITGNRRYLRASCNAQRKLERDHVLADGVPSATEHMRGIYSEAGHETCVITDYLWSLGVLLAATGDTRYADAMERIVFNALPGAVTSDFKSLQYFSGPNQVVADAMSNHHPHGKGRAHISYRPNPATECCPANVHRALPAYIGRMWMTDEKGGIVAALLGPGKFETRINNRKVTIEQETDYPFDQRIKFSIRLRTSMNFKFSIRIPAWCHSARLWVNGRASKRELKPGSFVELRRQWKSGDVVELELPRECILRPGPEKSVSIEYGPLVLALPVDEERTIETGDDRSTSSFPAWSMRPVSAWNYGVQRRTLKKAFKEGAIERPLKGNPWDIEHTPIRLHVPARQIAGWRLQQKKKLVMKWGKHRHVVEGDMRFMPPLPSAAVRAKARKREELVELVPYGATCLRLTWFPLL